MIVVLAAGAGTYAWSRGDDGSEDPRGKPAVTATPTLTPTPTPSPSPTPSPAPTPTSSPTPRLPGLPAASPRRLFSPGLLDAGFDDSIEPGGDRFTTRSTAELSRWGSRALPASPGTDTVFIAGRVAADGDSGFGALPRVSAGTRISIRTDEGVLTYTVGSVATRPAVGITRSPLFTQRVPGRLVLIGVRYTAGGSATSSYVVVTARLSGVQPD